MAQVGKTIVQPLSGERVTFLETSATTGGGLLKISIEMAPGGAVGQPHVHPRAAEEFEVVSGRIELKSSGKTRVAEAGESVIIPAGSVHVFGNPFNDPAIITVAVRPALKLETFFETAFGLARDGKLNSKTQMPGFLQAVLLAHEYRDDITGPGFVGKAARGLGAVLAPVARARGYRGRYPQYSDANSP